MSALPQPDAETMMVESIRADANAQVSHKIEAANAAALEETNQIEKAAQGVREEILARARDKARKSREREISLANVEARRLVLATREQSVNKVCDRIRAALNTIRADGTVYPHSLAALLREASKAIGDSKLRVTLSERDRGVAEELFAESPKFNGEDIDFTFVREHDGGGCVGQSHDGRIVFDNTYPRRLALAMRTLRANIIQEIVKHHE
ncbi:MAG: V-type ATP synthase subunit E [Candidatus Hydrogenedentes bacterium]|nr:V-type ATP synthase subunit E [Candidatus Hydrogenedentota bacterium]